MRTQKEKKNKKTINLQVVPFVGLGNFPCDSHILKFRMVKFGHISHENILPCAAEISQSGGLITEGGLYTRLCLIVTWVENTFLN